MQDHDDVKKRRYNTGRRRKNFDTPTIRSGLSELSRVKMGLDLAKVREHRVDQLERLVDLLSNFRASQDNLSAHENE